jgi:chemotaxis protein methyltransferase CheR
VTRGTKPDEHPEALLVRAGEILSTTAGFRLDGGMRGRLRRSLSDVAEARGEDVGAFVAALRSDPGALQALLDRFTVQETSFFRDPAQFDCLAADVLPSLPDPITVWSAGCANGQEAYSIAMALEESGRSDWRVIATDVSLKAAEKAGLGTYQQRELRGLSDARRDRFMLRAESGWVVSPELRGRVSVLRHNLVSESPPFEPGACPIVFCRNVLIYFDPVDAAAFLNRLHPWLPRSGYLFLGFSENLWKITDRFQAMRRGQAFVYRPIDGANAIPAKSPAPSHHRVSPGRRHRTSPRLPEAQSVLLAGQLAVAEGDQEAAISSFRQAAYLNPDDPIAHLLMAFTLEERQEQGAARRAFAAARAALGRTEHHDMGNALEGFDPGELADLLDAKLGGSS